MSWTLCPVAADFLAGRVLSGLFQKPGEILHQARARSSGEDQYAAQVTAVIMGGIHGRRAGADSKTA